VADDAGHFDWAELGEEVFAFIAGGGSPYLPGKVPVKVELLR
jgi:hypothetical protein